MNIFKIMSMGSGRLQETNLSAFLSYLLDPNQDHGLKSKFLESFLNPVIRENKDEFSGLIKNVEELRDFSNKNNFSIDVELESKVIIKKKQEKVRYIDVVLEIIDKAEEDDLNKHYIVCIENKIKKSTINKDTSNQLIDELEGIIDRITEDEGKSNVKIIMIFLTKDYSENAKEAYNTFREEVKSKKETNNLFCKHLIWSKSNAFSENSIFEQLTKTLGYENSGIIDPIYEYSKHTIKSLLNYISTGFKSIAQEKSQARRTGPIEIKIDNNTFKANSLPTLYEEVFTYLHEKQYLNKLPIPFFSSNKGRFLIADKEIENHPNMRQFFTPKFVDRYKIEASWQRKYGLKLLEKICDKKYLNIDFEIIKS